MAHGDGGGSSSPSDVAPRTVRLPSHPTHLQLPRPLPPCSLRTLMPPCKTAVYSKCSSISSHAAFTIVKNATPPGFPALPRCSPSCSVRTNAGLSPHSAWGAEVSNALLAQTPKHTVVTPTTAPYSPNTAAWEAVVRWSKVKLDDFNRAAGGNAKRDAGGGGRAGGCTCGGSKASCGGAPATRAPSSSTPVRRVPTHTRLLLVGAACCCASDRPPTTCGCHESTTTPIVVHVNAPATASHATQLPVTEPRQPRPASRMAQRTRHQQRCNRDQHAPADRRADCCAFRRIIGRKRRKWARGRRSRDS